ncbi:MAG: T9SS type A sorting domain-containing protein [Bacteroidia bacterium]
MKKIILGLCFLLTGAIALAQNGLEGIIVEKYYVSNAADSVGANGFGDNLPVGSVTYRIYVDMLPGYKFQAAYGVPTHALTLTTTTSFYNNTDRGHEIPSFSKTNAAQHTTMLDSYFSVGAACSGSYGILKSEDSVASGGANVVNAHGILQNNDPLAGIPLTIQDGIYTAVPAPQSVTFVGMAQAQTDFDGGPSVSSFITTNASWAALIGSTGPIPAANKVLIAQVTTNGIFHFELNIQIGTPTGGVQNYVSFNPVGAEITIPGLKGTFGGQIITGPSSSQSPYVIPVAPGVTTTSVLTTPDIIGSYKMCGTPDGLGAFDNGNGTFTLLMNHEFVPTVGVVRAHGSAGAFVSKWIINKSNLSVVSGSDLIQTIYLWNQGTNSYAIGSIAFNRFCSGDLPSSSAFYNAATGLGTQERIYMNGEESGSEGRAFGHIVTGTNTGVSYQLPWLGRMSWENAVANPVASDKTIVGCLDDGATTSSNVYFYIGTKTNTGTEFDKAGLTNGKSFGVKITGYPQERINATTINNPPSPGTHFDLVDLGSVQNKTGVYLDSLGATLGVTYFARTEDGAWDPSHPNDFYFNTTDQLDQVNDGVGSQVGRSRLWRLRFTDIANPETGGTVEAVLNGTEGQVMLDNLTIDKSGHILLQEDVGNSAHNGKVWQYTIATDSLKQIAKHDLARFGDIGVPATAPFNQDEETSGIIDVSDILGAGKFLLDDQAHYAISGEAVEGGQLLMLFNPDTYNGLVLSSSHTNVNCNGGNNATIDLTVSGGTAAYSYLWSNAGTTEDLSSLPAGTYTVTVTDAVGTTSTTSVAITQPTILSANCAVLSNISCNGGSNGSVSVSGSGGTPPYVISPSTAGLAAGTYTFTVTDAHGCTATCQSTITQPTALNLSITTQNATCGTKVGLTIATVSGGTPKQNPANAYSYLWSNGKTLLAIGALSPGNYTVTITDSLGCTVTGTASITSTAIQSVSVSTVKPNCFGSNDGSACVTGTTGGTGPFTYSWNTVPVQTTTCATGLSKGTWQVIITTADGCHKTRNVTINDPAQLIGAATAASANSAIMFAQGGTKPYTYLWSNGQTTRKATSLGNGTYTVTVTDAKGCTVTSTVTIGGSIRLTGETLNEMSTMNVYPNPTENGISISFMSFEEQPYTLSVMDVVGNIVYAEKGEASEGENEKEFSFENFARGIYAITISTNQFVLTSRVVVK